MGVALGSIVSCHLGRIQNFFGLLFCPLVVQLPTHRVDFVCVTKFYYAA